MAGSERDMGALGVGNDDPLWVWGVAGLLHHLGHLRTAGNSSPSDVWPGRLTGGIGNAHGDCQAERRAAGTRLNPKLGALSPARR